MIALNTNTSTAIEKGRSKNNGLQEEKKKKKHGKRILNNAVCILTSQAHTHKHTHRERDAHIQHRETTKQKTSKMKGK